MTDRERIIKFLDKAGVFVLSYCTNNTPEATPLFYAFSAKHFVLIFKSKSDSSHMKSLQHAMPVAGAILGEERSLVKLKGIQFKGTVVSLCLHQEVYYSRYPAARLMNGVLMEIRIDEIKMTDNTLGFGKKIVWKRETLHCAEL